MRPAPPLRAVVVGGGPGGLAAAIALAATPGPRRWQVDVFEKRPLSAVTDGTDERRTYGMVLGARRTLSYLTAAGVDAAPIVDRRRLVATAFFGGGDGSFSQTALVDDGYSGDAAATAAAIADPAALFMVDRAHFVACLVAHVDAVSPGVSLHWGAPLAGLDPDARVARFACGADAGAAVVDAPYDLLVGADGGASATRAALAGAGLVGGGELPSPVSLTEYKTFHSLDDAGAAALGLDTAGRGSTFVAWSSPPAGEGGRYGGSMTVHRRPRGRGWSGLLSQAVGVFAEGESATTVLDRVLGAHAAAFPAGWRASITKQLAEGRDVGALARLLRASRLAVPEAGAALVGDAATTNTPQLGQGAGSAVEDGAALAAALAGADDAASIAAALVAYDAQRRPARYALQQMEREMAVTNRPPPVGEPAEDAATRAAWRSFFARGREAHGGRMDWWNRELHSTRTYDDLYAEVRREW
jgi:2-polyprenyl-6-methoxyphenol hydroxylase-like FAD-dependent oxidoreductase